MSVWRTRLIHLVYRHPPANVCVRLSSQHSRELFSHNISRRWSHRTHHFCGQQRQQQQQRPLPPTSFPLSIWLAWCPKSYRWSSFSLLSFKQPAAHLCKMSESVSFHLFTQCWQSNARMFLLISGTIFIQQEFNKAAEDVKNLTTKPNDTELLEVYSLFKQANEGDVGTGKNLFDYHFGWLIRFFQIN